MDRRSSSSSRRVAILSVSPLVALISAATYDGAVWRRAGYGESAKIVWIVLCFALGPIDGIGYLVGVWPKLRKAT